jgi:hypothetical protein
MTDPGKPSGTEMVKKCVENINVIYLDGSKFSSQFSIVCFCPPNYWPRYSAHFISMDLLLSYINRYTAHYSLVLFWIWLCLDQIKVIARAHPGHHFHR